MKACVRFLWLAMAAGACAAARLPSAATSSPGSDQGSSPTAAQLAEAVLDPSIPPEQAIDAVLSAGRVVEVNSSLDLWQALQEQQEGVLSVVLQGDVALDDPAWEQPTFIKPGMAVILKSELDTDSMDVRRSADAIQQAGAATLDLAQREEAIIVEPGGLLGLEGLLLRNNAPTGAWLAKRPDQPRGIGFNPAIICQPEGLNVHRRMYTEFWQADCSSDNIDGILFRVGLLVGNASEVTRLNATTYSFSGPRRFDINLDNIFTCRVDPTATLQATASATESQADSSEGGGGTPGWVWALVAVAASAAVAVMGAVAVLLRRRRRQRRAQAQPGEADSSLTPAESPAGPPGQLSLIRTSSPEDKDLEKAITPALECELSGTLQQLRGTWSSRIGEVQGLQLLEPIGRGGFATVWKARWRGFLVSAKVIEHGLSGGILASIHREASVSTSVSHPNVATYKVVTLNLRDLTKLQPQVEVEAAGPQPLPESIGQAAAGTVAPAMPLADRPASSSASQGLAVSPHSNSSRLLRWLTGSAGRRGVLDSSSAAPAGGASILVPASSRDGIPPRMAKASVAPPSSQLHPAASLPDSLTAEPDQAPSMGVTLIVQELCSRSVEDCMRDGRVLYAEDGSPDQASFVAIVRMLIDAAQGLDYLSVAGIVHGDVKAANVLLSAAGWTKRGWQAKIADLGLSRMLPPDAAAPLRRRQRQQAVDPNAVPPPPQAAPLRRRRQQAVDRNSVPPSPVAVATSMSASAEVGTAAYMAPEVFAGRLTKASDVFSFGILMYEVWMRRRAWPGLPLAKLIFAVVSQHSRPPVPPGCPDGYAALMQQCWADAPEERPTFEGLLQSLQSLLKQLLQEGAPDTAGRRVQLDRPPFAGSLL
ncbi:hypothetical protein CHLNCDRAFT_133304 [Chlorella variabilis]|uniref:Protein kinase domain-containing protein n=1 Tax=Chlorella variabilis TaxID=554065 RepID=E1Z2U2_CHLVA|nr:hypothetical protein CHLNCDRAFT_133304 [Chlorella variabilis]EFN59725.1 hypothetical protein CHLNCDRAFT_133304 [Chlorella variabilis]|eukprot:XP_005851827.1 hypothetical protein CHLNCDRAFT_133304 [Chlorella variabilis]